MNNFNQENELENNPLSPFRRVILSLGIGLLTFIIIFLSFALYERVYDSGSFLVGLGTIFGFFIGRVVGVIIAIICLVVFFTKPPKNTTFANIVTIIFAILLFLSIIFISWSWLFNTVDGTPSIPLAQLCFISGDKSGCLFTFYANQAIKNNDLKYCQILYDKYNLDPKFISDFAEGISGVWNVYDTHPYPNMCTRYYQQYYYVVNITTPISRLANPYYPGDKNYDLIEPSETSNAICDQILGMNGDKDIYSYYTAECYRETQEQFYKGFFNKVQETGDITLCDKLKTIKGYSDSSVYNVVNCKQKIYAPELR